uniref:Uncharacterized protein n=1 Tax=Medicago truncatula TaxID=3880 RepID=Q2HSG8_MEDTR|nr:hypothetical protein MtrDRAFT_AC151523g18v2 [Medicago truncatula]ABN09026.1 hypothetical protein MtrDRAFT_AC172742g6v1 [Medicago truncatula]ABN09031.1 hypothetical protein MtrDRAFT_AC172742g32v1 [Medicago truncatula]
MKRESCVVSAFPCTDCSNARRAQIYSQVGITRIHVAIMRRNNNRKLSITDGRNRMQGATSVMSMQLSPCQAIEWE